MPEKDGSNHEPKLDSSEPPSSMPTFRCWHEGDQTTNSIGAFICDPPKESPLEEQPFTPDPSECEAWKSSSYSRCPASFGDSGTTATAGAYGQLVQFSDYLDSGKSGMFCAGHSDTEEPYLVTERTRKLHSLASDTFGQVQRVPFHNLFGLKLMSLELSRITPPNLKWFQNQWPRYEYKRGCFATDVELSIQFIIRDRTVFQQCILENMGDPDIDLLLAFCKGMSIRELDHVREAYKFNKTIPNDYNAGPGPGGFGWVHLNRFNETSSNAGTDFQASHDSRSNDNGGNASKIDQANHGVALVVSMAVDGKMIQFGAGQSPYTWHETLRGKSSTSEPRRRKLEIVTAYKLVRVDESLEDWKRFVIPLKKMNLSKVLSEARALSQHRIWITKIRGKDDLAHNYDKQDLERLTNTNGNGSGYSSPSEDREPDKPLIMWHIEFVVRRNLMHILDVCAIPVTIRVSTEDSETVQWERKGWGDVQPIALTCGDISSHRISSSSSFFMFQFLTEIASRIQSLPKRVRDDTQVHNLLARIRNVCLGHLKWIYAVQKTGQDGILESRHWVTGEPILTPPTLSEASARGSQQNVRNTALQILKAMAFADAFDGEDYDDWSLMGVLISQWAGDWVRWLERSDRRDSLTWHHKQKEGLSLFRLDDHVWICKALKAMEDERLGAWTKLHHRAHRNDQESSTASKAFEEDDVLRRFRKFTSDTVQREVLGRFTAEHDILQKQMIALTRSPRETRFLFHARDTALLYGQGMGFLSGGAEFLEPWQNTLNSQRHHENNQDTRWDNALRYALSIMLGIRGHQINNRRPTKMVRIATKILLGSSGENGLFPGKLDIATKVPLDDVFSEEEDADSYYDAGFEIPYIFLIHARAIGAIIDDGAHPILERVPRDMELGADTSGDNPIATQATPAHGTSNESLQVDETEQRQQRLFKKQLKVLFVEAGLPNFTSAGDYTRTRQLAMHPPLAFKKAIHFGKNLKPHSIFEVEDEWLFKYPEFFGFEDDANTSIEETLGTFIGTQATWLEKIDVEKMRAKYSPHADQDGRTDDCGLRLVDLPGQQHLQGNRGKIIPHVQSGSFEHVFEYMCRPRTPAKATKREISWEGHNTHLGLEAALLCYAASKGEEKAKMLDFFGRHFRREKFLLDQCNLEHNTWETEIHLSFLTLVDESGQSTDDAARNNVERFPGSREKMIFRDSMGMRFSGDAFNGYWTLHKFAFQDSNMLPGTIDALERFLPTNTTSIFQRKVRELHVVSDMLGHVALKTSQVFTEVKSEMGIKSGAFGWSTPNMDTFASWSELVSLSVTAFQKVRRAWEGFAPLLQALAEDLISVQEIISQWEARDSGWGQERPCWTDNDEKTFRADITRGQRMLAWRKKEVKELLYEVQSLREMCTSRLENAREELEFRSDQNIASFTYVTIVFLPLGFAASIFSMNGYPAASWVASMALIAVVTLTITAIALSNAKFLLAVVELISRNALDLTRAVFKSSLIGQQQHLKSHDRPHSPQELKDSSLRGQKVHGLLQNHASRHVVFWIAYLLIEVPVRRVTLACRAIGLPLTNASPSPDVNSSHGSPDPCTVSLGRKVIWVLGGILFLPLLLVSWTIQLLCYNTFDILAYLSQLILDALYSLVSLNDAHAAMSDTKMVQWLMEPTSSLRPVRKLMDWSATDKTRNPNAVEPMVTATTQGDSKSSKPSEWGEVC